MKDFLWCIRLSFQLCVLMIGSVRASKQSRRFRPRHSEEPIVLDLEYVENIEINVIVTRLMMLK